MQISVLGCGWLGLPLAKSLIECGHTIVATKRSEDQAAALGEFNIMGLSYCLGENLSKPYFAPIFQSDVLIVNIQPGRKTFQPEQFIAHMMDLIQQAKTRGIDKLIFISTSAVYGDDSRVVYEYSEPRPVTHSAKAHLKLEQFCQRIYGEDVSILRLGGLIGPDRHPVRSLSGKSELTNGQRIVNLVHQQDVVQAIVNLIEKQIFGHTLHLCSSDHPTRKSYYQWAAKQLNLPMPEFLPLHDALDKGKQINSDLTLDSLGLNLVYSSPFDMLDNRELKTPELVD